jgi:2-(1,2-epoxy-1,2-dihydrophenyl)acetyl-CoA isomerase
MVKNMAVSQEPVVKIEREGGVAILTLNRPDSLNALNTELMRTLPGEVRNLAEDDSVACVVITGAGEAFCAGGDVKAMSQAAQARVDGTAPRHATHESRVRWLRRSSEATRILFTMPKPAIAMINGACAGAGLAFAGACDFRFASDRAKFVPSLVVKGMPGDYGGAWFWTHILGTAKARQLYLDDRRRTAAEALAFGLVDQVIEHDRLREEVMALAHRLAGYPPSGVAYLRENLTAATTEPLDQYLERESQNMMLARNALVDLQRRKS